MPILVRTEHQPGRSIVSSIYKAKCSMSTQGTRQCHWRICSSSLLHHILYPPSNLISGGCDSVLWHPWVIGLKHTQHQWKVNRKQAWKAYLEQRNGILIWLFTRCLISVSLCELFFLYKDKTVQIQTILHWYTITVNLPSYHCKKISSFETRGANKAEMGQNFQTPGVEPPRSSSSHFL